MTKKHFLSALGASLLLLTASCSTDDSRDSGKIEDLNGNQISNGSMSLQYGGDELNRYVGIENSSVSFIKFNGEKIGGKSSTYTPDLTGAIAVTGNNFYNINNRETYYIPQGTTFTGGFNFNSAGKIIVLGNFSGTNTINVPNGAKIEVGTVGYINKTVNIILNAGSQLDNYGLVNYSSGSVSGTINNYSDLKFNNDINLNGNSNVLNYCKMTFEGNTNYLNAGLNNSGYLSFAKGFSVNGNGSLNLQSGSFTEVKGGTINIDGKIKNTQNDFARLDIANARFGTVNATPAITGKIDVNFSNTDYTLFKNNSKKTDANVVFNGNTYIAANNCTPEKGIPACNDNLLQFTLVANVTSPSIDGKTLSATDVKVNNGFAYVSYHTNDEVYGNSPYGALRIFNVTDINTPTLLHEAKFNNLEFNGVDVNNNILYAVGGNKNGAKLMTTPLNNGVFNTTDLSVFKEFSLPSASAKNSFFYNNYLWAVSGATNGGYFKLDPSNNYSVVAQLYTNGERAKYSAHNNKYQAFFAVEANGAFLKISNLDGSDSRTYTYPTLKQNTVNGKNVITMDDEYVYIALSDKGVAKIKLSNGVLVNQFTPSEFKNSDNELVFKGGLTNAVAIGDCYLYLANGVDGVIVLNKNTFNVVGYYKLSNVASANYIYIKNGIVFVGNGTGGLSILKIN